MYDGINTDASIIRKVAKPGDGVAYYIDGWFAWTPQQIALFPDCWHVTITVLGNPADAGDCETGDMTPDGAARWAVDQKTRGYWRPTIYRSLSLMGDIRKSTGNLVMGVDWDAWVADYDNSMSSDYAKEAAKQFRNTAGFDQSEVYDPGWPHRVKPVPTKPGVPAPYLTRWGAGVVLQFGNVGNSVLALQKALNKVDTFGVRNLTEDGKFGMQTQTAVKNFEALAKIGVDTGVAGGQVRNALIHMGMLSADGVPA
jgi:hypothetical protein